MRLNWSDTVHCVCVFPCTYTCTLYHCMCACDMCRVDIGFRFYLLLFLFIVFCVFIRNQLGSSPGSYSSSSPHQQWDTMEDSGAGREAKRLSDDAFSRYKTCTV